MKSIKLTGPTIVGGVLRRPHENPLTVSNKEASRLVTADVLAEDPADAVGDDPEDSAEDSTGKAGNAK